jgi:hypothetical protein
MTKIPQVEENELKTDAKIDLLHRSRLATLSSPSKQNQSKTGVEAKGEYFREEDIEMHDVSVYGWTPVNYRKGCLAEFIRRRSIKARNACC